jgi:hypothetical protein
MKTPTQRPADILELTLTMPDNAVPRVFPLFGEGILVQGTDGDTVEDFLVKTAGIPPAYLKERVQTVFLDGRALDDFNTARVTDGATLALSAAMPGLAGAVLRRGGVYAAMRRQISQDGTFATAGAGDIFITLKLFNMIAAELGPEFLRRGILIPGARLRDFVDRQGRWAWAGCRSATADEQPVAVDRIAELLAKRRWVRLSIHASNDRTGA